MISTESDAVARRKGKGTDAGRPLDFDAENSKNRKVVERAVNMIKCGLATRYDKQALTYRGGVVLPDRALLT